mmetsp:Transcript_15300/g.42156  ORF Transcript_15300/g.42156 Transcript_15300/m.42156 type:complete len:202 (-) Transcript_15300:1630-2235(-)
MQESLPSTSSRRSTSAIAWLSESTAVGTCWPPRTATPWLASSATLRRGAMGVAEGATGVAAVACCTSTFLPKASNFASSIVSLACKQVANSAKVSQDLLFSSSTCLSSPLLCSIVSRRDFSCGMMSSKELVVTTRRSPTLPLGDVEPPRAADAPSSRASKRCSSEARVSSRSSTRWHRPSWPTPEPWLSKACLTWQMRSCK